MAKAKKKASRGDVALVALVLWPDLAPAVPTRTRELAENPMLLAGFGRGPDGAKCGDCAFCQAGTRTSAQGRRQTFYACTKRRHDGRRATDHRLRFDACSLFRLRTSVLTGKE